MSAEAFPARSATPQPTKVPSTLSSGSFSDENDLTTLPDPRSRAMSPALADGAMTPGHHPDLNQEVATLSTKLVNAINHQTNLDDTLSHTRVELEQAQEKIRLLEEQNAQQKDMLAGDVWVRRKTVESERSGLLSRVAEEKKARLEVEQQKKGIEQELENLTAALFEEANKMVIAAKEESRREQEAVLRKNDLLRAQVADTEGLLKSQQDQLVELKQVMEQMSADHDDQTALTTPSSPGFSKFDAKEDGTTSDTGSQAGLDPISPSYPTSFTHLLQPVLRTDVHAYEDFIGLVRTSKRLSVRSRPPSGTQSGFAALGLALAGSSALGNGSSTSLSTAGTPASGPGSSPQTPNTPATTASTSSAAAIPLPPLKETKFYKRVLAEDIEPTLRLDTAPGLSWLARRSVVTAMTEGNLVVEPMPTTGPLIHITKPQQFPCSLCGDNRKDEKHLRRHRFRTSELESAQRYPLCKYCLGRVRSTCDFLGFLRIVKDGHWRADDEDAEKAAWEESVRLREQMFWARIGGGVVPTVSRFQHGSRPASVKSPRVSQGETKSSGSSVHEAEEKGLQSEQTINVETSAEDIDRRDHEPIKADDVPVESAPKDIPAPQTPPPSNNRGSTQSLSADSDKEDTKRLSIHIPGFP